MRDRFVASTSYSGLLYGGVLVTGAGGMLGHDVLAAVPEARGTRATSSTSPTPTPCATAVRAARARRASSTARPGPTSTAPRPTRPARLAVNGRGARARRRRRGGGRRRGRARLHRLRLRRRRRASPTSSPTRPARLGPTAARSSPARRRCARPTRATTSSAPPGCSAPSGKQLRGHDAPPGRRARRAVVVDDQTRLPHLHRRTSPPRCSRSPAREAYGDLARRRRRALHVVRPGRRRRSSGRAARCASCTVHDGRDASAAPLRARPGACSAPSAPTRWRCPRGRTASTPTSTRSGDRRDEAARLRRRRLHRLALRPRARARARRRARRARQADLRRAAGEPRRHPARRSSTAGIEDAAKVADGDGRRATRSSTSPPRPTSTARSPSPTRS